MAVGTYVPQVPRQEALANLHLDLPDLACQAALVDSVRLERIESERMDRLREARARLFDLALKEIAKGIAGEPTLPVSNRTLPWGRAIAPNQQEWIMAEKTTLDDVKRIAWAACDTFRGVIDASEYKDFILVFLFLKYVSDVWKEHYQEADQRYEGDELRLRRKMARERFVIPKGASFDDLYRQRNADNVGELIDQALDAIAEANKAKIGDAFADVMFNSETKLGDTKNRNRRLKSLIEDFAKLDLRPSRVVARGRVTRLPRM